MNGHTGDNGFELLTALRRLEMRLRRLKAAWALFRDEPSQGALEVLRDQMTRLSSDLGGLSAGLGATEKALRGAPSEATSSTVSSRPAARDVVRASRELDSWIWQAARCWKEVLDDPTGDRLRGLVRILARSARRSATLIEALGGSESPTDGSVRLPEPPGGSQAERIETWSRELEGLIWRLQADWHHVRRAPTVDRIRVLRAQLEEAAGRAEGLRLEVRTAGDTVFRRSLRVGLHAADAVRFLPYRDPFTGVYNREGFDALASAELKRCRRYDRRFGLLIIRVAPPDLSTLRKLVAATRAELRGYDLIARYALDLLAIGIPEGGGGATRRVASRVLKAMRRSSVGDSFAALAYAVLPDDGSTLSGLLDAATARLAGLANEQPEDQEGLA